MAVVGIGSTLSKWITPDGGGRGTDPTTPVTGVEWVLAAWTVLRSGCRWCGTTIWNLYGVGLWCHALPLARNFTFAIHLSTHLISTRLALLGLAFPWDKSWLFPLANSMSVGTGCRSRRSPRQWRFDKSESCLVLVCKLAVHRPREGAFQLKGSSEIDMGKRINLVPLKRTCNGLPRCSRHELSVPTTYTPSQSGLREVSRCVWMALAGRGRSLRALPNPFLNGPCFFLSSLTRPRLRN
ncbi:hypothetical protein B0T13DRAFT_461344 [Neurospora crassa]|nr:hypothetical protein B0T13DRAFT_461344 [Neurospora crassa]